jgi:hypothetical protein
MSSEEYILKTNELGVNAFTTTKKYIWRDNGSGLVVNFTLSKRVGCTGEMVLDTVANFLHAAKKLWVREFDAGENFVNRANYQEELLHGEARVNIFGDLPVDGGAWKFSVNICNEFTSAQMILNMASFDMMTNESMMVWGCQPISNGNGNGHKKPQQKQAPGKQQQDSKPPAPKQSQPTPDGITEIDYDEAKYANQLVAIPFVKLRRAIEAKNDGSGSYEGVFAYGWYEGQNGRMVSKYPTYTIFKPKEERNFSDWKKFFGLLKDSKVDELTVPGQEWEQPGKLIIKIDKKEKGIFWNLQNVVFDDEYMPSVDQSDAPDWGQDDIPWSDGDDPDNDPGRHLDM